LPDPLPAAEAIEANVKTKHVNAAIFRLFIEALSIECREAADHPGRAVLKCTRQRWSRIAYEYTRKFGKQHSRFDNRASIFHFYSCDPLEDF